MTRVATTSVEIGQTKSGKLASLPLAKANRHGLVTGSTGSGKTTSLQHLAEEFSTAGVSVFTADIKGDLSGVAAAGDASSPLAQRATALGRQFNPERFAVQFWDQFGEHGLPIRTSVQAMARSSLPGCSIPTRPRRARSPPCSARRRTTRFQFDPG